MLGTGWMVRTARECGKLPEGLAAIKRASQENSSFSLTQIRSQKKRQALADRILWVLKLNQHTQISLRIVTRKRLYRGQSLWGERRLKTTGEDHSHLCFIQVCSAGQASLSRAMMAGAATLGTGLKPSSITTCVSKALMWILFNNAKHFPFHPFQTYRLAMHGWEMPIVP